MSEFLDFLPPADYVIRIPREERVDYHIHDNTGVLKQHLGSAAVATMLEGAQPWADFAFISALERPGFKHNELAHPTVLDEAGYRIYTSREDMFQRYRSEQPEEIIDDLTQLYPDLRFTQRDVAFQYELVYDEQNQPRLRSEREHPQVGTFNPDGSFTPFVTILDWAHPAVLEQG